MSFEFKKEHLEDMIPSNKKAERWYDAMVEIFPKYDIDTPERIAGFVAQCAHESGDFKTLEENLNYSESALNKVFGRYFGKKKRDAKEYARNPEKIANYVYMDEFRSKAGALGNVKDGDGWKFRGRGLKQLTGRANYAAFGKTIDMTADEAADYVATEKGAIESACWFWNTRKLNDIADSGDITKMTKIINGGSIGLADRKKRYESALDILGKTSQTKSTPALKTKPKVHMDTHQTLKIGSNGDDVTSLQEALKIKADGSFGLNTKRAVRAWQKENGLISDGIAGPSTLKKLFD